MFLSQVFHLRSQDVRVLCLVIDWNDRSDQFNHPAAHSHFELFTGGIQCSHEGTFSIWMWLVSSLAPTIHFVQHTHEAVQSGAGHTPQVTDHHGISPQPLCEAVLCSFLDLIEAMCMRQHVFLVSHPLCHEAITPLCPLVQVLIRAC